MKISIFIIFLLLTSSAFTQTTTTLQGNVKDKNTLLPISSASVKGKDLNNGNELFSTSTNSIGDYFTEVTSTGIDDDPLFVTDFSLGQNYPNPFNPSTRFGFHAPAYGNYLLLISDVLGKELFRWNYELSTGNYVFSVSGLGVAGVKFYTLTGDDNKKTKKMMQTDGTDFNPSVSVSSGEFKSLSKVNDNLEMRILASKEGYFSDSVDVSFIPGGSYVQDFLLEKIPLYVLNAVVKVYNMKGDVVTDLDFMRWTWPDGTTEDVPVVNGEMVLNKSFNSLNSDTSATVTPDHPSLYLNWVIGTTNNAEKVEWLYQNATPANSNDAKVPLNKINNDTTEQYLVPKFVMYGVNNDTPIDMSGSVVTQMLSRGGTSFGIVSGFRPSVYDTTYVFQFIFNQDTGVPIAQGELDRAKNELNKVLSSTVWSHKRLLNYQFHLVESNDDSLWQYTINGPRNQENFTYTRFRSSVPGSAVTISLDDFRVKNSSSQYNRNNTNGQIQEEIFDSFCNTNVDGGDHLIALNLPGAPSTDLARTLIGIAYIMKPGTSYWNPRRFMCFLF
ncbi:MAG: hypothetical protein HXY50_01350 [Ignavibacteriaceae bacterium]|nr:hypothetical protein [Ignavibacteriaceae bacterium]